MFTKIKAVLKAYWKIVSAPLTEEEKDDMQVW